MHVSRSAILFLFMLPSLSANFTNIFRFSRLSPEVHLKLFGFTAATIWLSTSFGLGLGACAYLDYRAAQKRLKQVGMAKKQQKEQKNKL